MNVVRSAFLHLPSVQPVQLSEPISSTIYRNISAENFFLSYLLSLSSCFLPFTLYLFPVSSRCDAVAVVVAQGTGLGLSLARDIITLHGGRLECDSEVGQGCTFTIQICMECRMRSQRPPGDYPMAVDKSDELHLASPSLSAASSVDMSEDNGTEFKVLIVDGK